jgi:hypothetical protein
MNIPCSLCFRQPAQDGRHCVLAHVSQCPYVTMLAWLRVVRSPNLTVGAMRESTG